MTCMYVYVCLFGSSHIATMTKVNLRNQLTNVSGQIQANLCGPMVGCNRKKILARGDLEDLHTRTKVELFLP